jgi:hypothetical protein
VVAPELRDDEADDEGPRGGFDLVGLPVELLEPFFQDVELLVVVLLPRLGLAPELAPARVRPKERDDVRLGATPAAGPPSSTRGARAPILEYRRRTAT